METSVAARRWSAIGGLAFVVLFVLGAMLSAPDLPDADAPVGEWADWLNDKGGISLASAYLLVLAGLCLVMFGIGLALRIRATRGQGTLTAPAVLGLSVVTGGLIAAGGVAINTPPILYLFEDNAPDPVDVSAVMQMQSLGYGLFLVAAMLAAAAMIAIATAALRGTVPGWFTIFGYVCAVALLGAIVFIPIVALPIWVLIGSILFLRRDGRAPDLAAA